jgi:hypothetical protein
MARSRTDSYPSGSSPFVTSPSGVGPLAGKPPVPGFGGGFYTSWRKRGTLVWKALAATRSSAERCRVMKKIIARSRVICSFVFDVIVFFLLS